LKPEPTAGAQFGWKTSYEHFNDRAVYLDPWGIWRPLEQYPAANGQPQHGCPVDMAFAITSKKECLKPWAPEYADWIAWGRPDCWCCKRQCRGDADCAITGPFWVALPDLNILKAAFNKADDPLRLIPRGICADFDHAKTGPFRVALPDLNILKAHFNKRIVPCCDLNGDCILTPADKYLFWTN
jgi:hypothetical protein